MSQTLEKQLKKPTRTIYHPELLELAEQIRNLKSEQIFNEFTDGEGHRCVMGALAVEVFDAEDNIDSIKNCLYGLVRSKNEIKGLVYEMWCRLADMNNYGMTFDEIANEVEKKAYE